MSRKEFPGAGQSACGGPVACTPIAYNAAIFSLTKTTLKGLESIDWGVVTRIGVNLYNNILPKSAGGGWFATYANVNKWVRANQPAMVEKVGSREFTLPRYCKMTEICIGHVKNLEALVPDLFSEKRIVEYWKMLRGEPMSPEFTTWFIDARERLNDVDESVFEPVHYSNLNLFATQVLKIDDFSKQLQGVEIDDQISKKRNYKRDFVVTGTVTKAARTTAFWTNGTDYAYMDSHGSSFTVHEFKEKEFNDFMRAEFCDTSDPVWEVPPDVMVDQMTRDFQENPNLQTTAVIFKMVEKYQ